MIIQEEIRIPNDERDFIHTYSDAHRYVVREGVEYEDAIDPAEFHREYTEGREIENWEEIESNQQGSD